MAKGVTVQLSGISDLVKELERYTQNTDGHMKMVVY